MLRTVLWQEEQPDISPMRDPLRCPLMQEDDTETTQAPGEGRPPSPTEAPQTASACAIHLPGHVGGGRGGRGNVKHKKIQLKRGLAIANGP